MDHRGRIGWVDLTVDNASSLRDFYAEVVGWTPQGVDMGGYDDYMMKADGDSIAGVCHRKGPNAALPPQWIVYFVVEDLDAAVTTAVAQGGTLLSQEDFALIRDPAGALFALSSGGSG